MYESFFGLREKPFSLLPDPSFLFPSKIHQEALTLVEYGLLNQTGFTILSGEIGSGKTTLMRYLLGKLENDFTVGLISNTHQSLGELMDWICAAFELKVDPGRKLDQHQAFVNFLIDQYAKGRRTLLIVDEAQNLGIERLEELRLLSNINADKDLVLQLLLLGQPQLRDQLHQPGLEQFIQRISASYHLGRLSSEDTFKYIRHRLMVAGGDKNIFTPDACHAVYHYSKGIPRVINLICDTAMVYAFAASEKTISGAAIDEFVRSQGSHLLLAVEDTKRVPLPESEPVPTEAPSSAQASTIESAIAKTTVAPDIEDAVPAPSDASSGTLSSPPRVVPEEGASDRAVAISTPSPATPTPLDGQPSVPAPAAHVPAPSPAEASKSAPADEQQSAEMAPIAPEGDSVPADASDQGWPPPLLAMSIAVAAGIALALWVGLRESDPTPGASRPLDSPLSSQPDTAENQETPGQQPGPRPTPEPLDEGRSEPAETDRIAAAEPSADSPMTQQVTPSEPATPFPATETSPPSSQTVGVREPEVERRIASAPEATPPAVDSPEPADQTSVPETALARPEPTEPPGPPSEPQAATPETLAAAPDTFQRARVSSTQLPNTVARHSSETAADTPVSPSPEASEPNGETSSPDAAPIGRLGQAEGRADTTAEEPPASLPMMGLERKLGDLSLSIRRAGDRHLEVDFERSVQFEGGSTSLDPASQATLARFADLLLKYDQVHATVIAHTDTSGGEELNRILSDRRAETVARFIRDRGIPAERLEHEGRGEAELKVGPEQERLLGAWVNRRIEIDLIEMEPARSP